METAEVTFDSGGVRCAATLYRPDSAEGPVACVVMGAGGTLTRRDGIPDYAARFAAGGLAVLAFDYRHWGDSRGQPRRFVSVARQLADWRAAVGRARGLDGVDPGRIAAWGMSLGGGHALMTAADDPGIAAVVALVPVADGVALWLTPAPLGVAARSLARAVRERVTGRPVTMPVAGPPGSFSVLAAPESLPGFERLAGPSGWRNEINAGAAFGLLRYRPVRRAARIAAPVLLQLGEHDAMVPPRPIEKAAARAPRAELARHAIDHFSAFWPENIDAVAGEQLAFLERHAII